MSSLGPLAAKAVRIRARKSPRFPIEIDLEKLSQLGDRVYPGGGQEIVEKVRQVLAAEKLQL